jgi:hypothetical protein
MVWNDVVDSYIRRILQTPQLRQTFGNSKYASLIVGNFPIAFIKVLALLSSVGFIQAYPLTGKSQDNLKRNFSLENAQDEWSTLIAGIAPLILLVGERVTKQHLREASTRFDYYILGATPIGLVTSLVSLLRLISLPIVLRLIGRSDELLQDTCKEITPVNTGSVSSILEGGRVQRGNPETQQGSTGVSTNVVSRLHFWNFRTTVEEMADEAQRIQANLKSMDAAYKNSTDLTIPIHNALLVGSFHTERPPFEVLPDIKRIYGVADHSDNNGKQMAGILSIKVTAVGGEVNFAKGEVRSKLSNISLVITSIILMLAVHLLALVDNDWQVTLAWICVVAGYIGLLLSVAIYAEAIKQRIDSMAVQLGPHTPGGDGTFVALQNGNLDQEGKTGYSLPISSLGHIDMVKISTLRQPSTFAQLTGTLAGVSFIASFLVHYLGLRSIQWWVSICELAICFIMVGFRTLVSRDPVIFSPSDSSFDFDLRSIGVITPKAQKRATVIDTDIPYQNFSCFRLFLGIRSMDVKTEGDTVAALLAANLNQMNASSRQRIFDIIGIGDCQMMTIPGSSKCVVIHCGGTGLLTTEGFLRPAKPLVWGTEFTLEQLDKESLVGWVIHGMNRNEELQLLKQFAKFTTQAVHIPATNSVVDWWLRSEGSNKWEYNVRNLQWSGALALALLLSKVSTYETLEVTIRRALERLLTTAAVNPTLTARDVAEDLRRSLEGMANKLERGEAEVTEY